MNVCISSVVGDAGEEKEGRPPVCRHGGQSICEWVRRAVLVLTRLSAYQDDRGQRSKKTKQSMNFVLRLTERLGCAD